MMRIKCAVIYEIWGSWGPIRGLLSGMFLSLSLTGHSSNLKSTKSIKQFITGVDGFRWL